MSLFWPYNDCVYSTEYAIIRGQEMDKELVKSGDPLGVLMVANATRDQRHRLAKYAGWLVQSATPWYRPDLAAYRDTLLGRGYKPSSASAHLSTVRSRYADLVRDRDMFYAIAATQTGDPLERKAIVDEMVTRIENATAPAAAPVKQIIKQDVPDSAQVRLTSAQGSALMAAPGVGTLDGQRDTAAIALLLCTGIREAELRALDVDDLRQYLGGELALHVREGKGCKDRMVPYGELSWVLAIVDKWLDAAGVTDGAVFRGFFKGNRLLRPGRLSVRQVQNILSRYPVALNGHVVKVRPHDCRRTYARRLYDAGVDVVAIQQNLGHARLETTLGYIGPLDADRRRAPAVYTFDLTKLGGT